MIKQRNVLVFLAGVAVLAALYLVFGVDEVLAAFRQVRPGWFVSYVVVASLVCAGCSLRWRAFARTLGDAPAFSRFLLARMAGDAIGSLAPVGRMGGDPVRVALLYGEGVSGARASASVVLDRIVEVIGNSLFAVASVSIFALSHTFAASARTSVLALVALVVPLLGLGVLLVQLRWGQHPLTMVSTATVSILRRLRRLAGSRPRVSEAGDSHDDLRRWPLWVGAVSRMEDDLTRFLRDRPAAFLGGIVASLVLEGVTVAEYYLLLAAFGLHLNVPTLLMVMVVTGLVRAVPVPASMGALEVGQVTLLTVAEGRPEVGLVVGTILRMHDTIWIAAGLAALSLQGVSFARLRGLPSLRSPAA